MAEVRPFICQVFLSSLLGHLMLPITIRQLCFITRLESLYDINNNPTFVLRKTQRFSSNWFMFKVVGTGWERSHCNSKTRGPKQRKISWSAPQFHWNINDQLREESHYYLGMFSVVSSQIYPQISNYRQFTCRFINPLYRYFMNHVPK